MAPTQFQVVDIRKIFQLVDMARPAGLTRRIQAVMDHHSQDMDLDLVTASRNIQATMGLHSQEFIVPLSLAMDQDLATVNSLAVVAIHHNISNNIMLSRTVQRLFRLYNNFNLYHLKRFYFFFISVYLKCKC